MPHQGRGKSTSFQLFPTGHLLLRISSVVSWGLEQMEWTGYSVQPLQQKFPPPSKLHYCIRFCTSGEKRQTLKYFVYFDSTCHLPRGALHTWWCCFGGGCAMGLLWTGWKMPQGRHKFGYCSADLDSDPDSELWPQLALLHQQPGGDRDFLSFVLTWDVAALHQTCGKYRIKNNSRILCVCGRFFWTGDILEYVIYVKNIPRKRGAGLPACCTLQSMYLISIFFF